MIVGVSVIIGVVIGVIVSVIIGVRTGVTCNTFTKEVIEVKDAVGELLSSSVAEGVTPVLGV